MYDGFIIPNNFQNDVDFLTHEFTDFLLRALGIDQEYAFSDCLTDSYWHEDQIGNLTAMTPGAVDVSNVTFPERLNVILILVAFTPCVNYG